MYSVLVVDDEPRHRKGLLNLINEIEPKYILYEAKNGKDALSIISNHKIDIIISDIKMPIMDGIELIKRVSNENNKIKMVMLSAYSQFEYAQQALKLGAFDYILKPIRKDKVRDILKRISIQLENERTQEIYNIEQKKKLDVTLPVYIEYLFNKWIRKEISSLEIKEINKILPYKGNGIILITHINNMEQVVSNVTDELLKTFKYDVKQCIRKNLLSLGNLISFFDERDKSKLITLIINTDIDILIDEKKESYFKKLIKDLDSQFHLNATIGISKYHYNINENCKSAFEEAEDAIKYKFYSDEKIIYSDNVLLTKYHYCNKFKEEEEIVLAIHNQERKRLPILVNELIKKIIRPTYPYPDHLKVTMIHIVKNIIINTNMGFFEEYENKMLITMENVINRSLNYQELISELINIILEFVDGINEYKNKKQQYIFQKVVNYIDENYFNDISLEEISSMVYLSAPYFSSFFKEMSGNTFSKYLQSVRLKEAKALLNNSHYKIYEIAKKVGYQDAKYFNRVFKSELGITPKEYRSLSIDGINLGGK